MKFYLMLLVTVSCADYKYTDPKQEKITYYLCDKNEEVLVKHADDYESILIRYHKDQQVLLHSFVTTTDTGYHNDNLLWLTKGNRAVLVEKFPDGSEKKIFKSCVAEKLKLQY
jgi:membrane-bound inhibitor of C-type lysozyme